MRDHGGAGDEQRLGDLAIGKPFGRELRDAAFASRERVRAADAGPAWSRAGDQQLGARLIGNDAAAAAVGEIKRMA